MAKVKKARKKAPPRSHLKKDDPRLKTNLTTKQKVKEQQQEALKRKLKEQKTGKKQKANAIDEDGEIDGVKIRRVEKANPNMFFSYNTSLGPPYSVIIDTNFLQASIENKLDLHRHLMDCLLAKVTPIIPDCVIAELEKLGPKYRLALKVAKDPRNERYPCSHKGCYADDCIVNRVKTHKCYIVATLDANLKRRIRKIPGVPIMYMVGKRFSIERFPDVNNAPAR